MGSPPVILVAGSEKSGKTSIIDVVFRKISAYKTYYQETTKTLQRQEVHHNPLFQYDVCELPSNPLETTRDGIHLNPTYKSQLANVKLLIYIIDLDKYSSRSDPFGSKNTFNFRELLPELLECNNDLLVSIFLHKTDINMSSEQLSNIQKSVQATVSDIYSTLDISPSTSYSRTCVFDYSISEAISKVIQRLIPHRPVLLALLNSFSQSSNIEKVYIFDTYCKICLAQDSTPSDIGMYELCRDNIEVISDIHNIYNVDMNTNNNEMNSEGIHSEDTNNHSSNKSVNSITKLERSHSTLGIYVYPCISNTVIVSILREEHFNKLGLIQYNLQQLNESIQKLATLEN
ncbi:hypothetical protein WA158_003448 [Blastocystis sp. Blastoise]